MDPEFGTANYTSEWDRNSTGGWGGMNLHTLAQDGITQYCYSGGGGGRRKHGPLRLLRNMLWS